MYQSLSCSKCHRNAMHKDAWPSEIRLLYAGLGAVHFTGVTQASFCRVHESQQLAKLCRRKSSMSRQLLLRLIKCSRRCLRCTMCSMACQCLANSDGFSHEQASSDSSSSLSSAEYGSSVSLLQHRRCFILHLDVHALRKYRSNLEARNNKRRRSGIE